MKKITSWIAGNGKEIVISHQTETTKIADHTLIELCDRIVMTMGGEENEVRWIKDGIIQSWELKVRIPTENMEAVMGLYDAINNRRDARSARANKTETEYNKHYAKVSSMMAE
jgi:hypothetical protein